MGWGGRTRQPGTHSPGPRWGGWGPPGGRPQWSRPLSPVTQWPGPTLEATVSEAGLATGYTIWLPIEGERERKVPGHGHGHGSRGVPLGPQTEARCPQTARGAPVGGPAPRHPACLAQRSDTRTGASSQSGRRQPVIKSSALSHGRTEPQTSSDVGAGRPEQPGRAFRRRWPGAGPGQAAGRASQARGTGDQRAGR